MKRSALVLLAPLLAAAAPVAPGTEADRAPDWLVRPDADVVARSYPERALRLGTEGSATIVCVLKVDTTLSACRVVRETPEDAGFGDAAIDVASEVRMSPRIVQGVPVESEVRIPFAFRLPERTPPPRILTDPGLMKEARKWLAIALGSAVGVLASLMALAALIRSRRPKP